MKRGRKRSFIKAITYRFICSLETLVVSWAVSGSLLSGSLISGVLFFTKIGTYFVHERIWEHIYWGKEYREKGVPREVILRKLGKPGVGDKMTWVGKNYSIADLRKDLGED
jgi:uncharacterized membrane protein